jgi:hypothetical protein
MECDYDYAQPLSFVVKVLNMDGLSTGFESASSLPFTDVVVR